MPKKLVPLGDDVIIHPNEDGDKRGSLYVPPAARQKTDNGIIVAVGPGCVDGLRPGDHVVFSPLSGEKISVDDGGVFFVMSESHVLAKIEESSVVMISTENVKRLIVERLGELRTRANFVNTLPSWLVHDSNINEMLDDIQESLIDRISSITQAEGFEY